MVRQLIDINGHWDIIVYYNLDAHYFNIVKHELLHAGCEIDKIREIKRICFNTKNTGFTFTNEDKHISIVGISKTSSVKELLHTIVHEVEHVSGHICDYYKVHNGSEAAAYLVQYIISKMYKVFNQWLCQ